MSVIVNERQLKRGLVNWNTSQKQYPGLNTELRTKQCVQNRAQET